MLKEVFNYLDNDKDGFITAQELADNFKRFEDFSFDQIEEMVRIADTDGDGKINYEELKSFMQYQDDEYTYQQYQDDLEATAN